MMPSELSRYDIRVGQLVSVYDDRIVFEKREFVSGLSIGDDWVVERPAKPRSFASLASAARPAEFPVGSELKVVRTTAKTRGLKNSKINIPSAAKPALSLVFPAATVGGQVAEYEISAVGGGGARYDTRICSIGGLYPRAHGNFGKAVTARIRVDALPSGAEKIAVAPLDSFGNRGRSLSATVPAMLDGGDAG